MLKKDQVQILVPCFHIVCKDCLLNWIHENTNEICPICRQQFLYSCFLNINGVLCVDVLSKLVSKKIICNPLNFPSPQQANSWGLFLKQHCEVFPDKIWEILHKYGIVTTTLVSIIMGYLAKSSKDVAKEKIQHLIGNLCPSFFELLIESVNHLNTKKIDSHSSSISYSSSDDSFSDYLNESFIDSN